MDHKSFKQDLTYSCKKFAKEGKKLSAWGDNLFIAEDAFHSDGEHLDPLEMFALVKNYVPTKTMLTWYHTNWKDKEDKVYDYNIPHHSSYNVSMVDVVSEQAAIAQEDIYAFLDGFDNVVSNSKNEFYTIGVYIREKFLPEGVRLEPLRLLGYQYNAMQGKRPLRLFVIHSMRGKTSIVEAECYVLTPMDDSTVMSLPKGEFRCLVAAPEILYEKKSNGIFGPAVFNSFAFFETAEAARDKAEADVRATFERNLRKNGISYTEEELQTKFAAIQTILLTT